MQGKALSILLSAGYLNRTDTFRPPFKAQNMSLNSYPTPEGGEIGRAQVVQAEAAGVIPHTDMNPVLLKPTNNKSSQVILNGKPMGNLSAVDYFGDHLRKGELFESRPRCFQAGWKQPIIRLCLKEREVFQRSTCVTGILPICGWLWL